MKKLEKITEECTIIPISRLNELLEKEKIYDSEKAAQENFYNWIKGSYLKKIKSQYNPKKKYKNYKFED